MSGTPTNAIKRVSSFGLDIVGKGKNLVSGISDVAKKGTDFVIDDVAKKGLEVIGVVEEADEDDMEDEDIEKEEEEIEMNKMKEGDYMVHVFIEYCKNIKMDAEDVVDPLVEVECLD